MKHLRLFVACAAVALSTAAMACDDDDDAPPERASVVQVHHAANAHATPRAHRAQQRAAHGQQPASGMHARARKSADPHRTAARAQPLAPRA